MRNKYLNDKKEKSDNENHQNISKISYPITVNKNKELKNNLIRNKNSLAKNLSRKNTESDLSKLLLEKSIQNVVIPDKIEHKVEKINKQEKKKELLNHILLNKTRVKKYILHKQKTQNKLSSSRNTDFNSDNQLSTNNSYNKVYIPKKLEKNNTSIFSSSREKKDIILDNNSNNNKAGFRKRTICGISMFCKNSSILDNDKKYKENPNKTEAFINKQNEKNEINITEIEPIPKKLKKNSTSEFYKTMNNLRNSEMKSNTNSNTNITNTIKTTSTINSNNEELNFKKKRNTNKSEEVFTRKTYRNGTINSVNKHSFQYLIHQAHNNISISTSFNRCYEKRQIDSNQVSDDEDVLKTAKKKKDTLTNRNFVKNTPTGLSIFSKMNGFKSLRNKNIKMDFRKKDDVNNTVLETNKNFNLNDFKGENNENNENNEKINISNKIINNNIYNTTLNVYKFNDSTSKNILNSFNNQKITQNYIETNNLFINDIKQIIFIQEKIIKSLNNNVKCNYECEELINLFFNQDIYNEFNQFIFEIRNQKKILQYLKFEIISYFICLDCAINQNYNQCIFLLKTIYNLINRNWQKILVYVLDKNSYNSDSENQLTEVVYNNFNSIVTYYKMIIDSIYKKYYEINNIEIKFPYCIYNYENMNTDNKKNKEIISKIKATFFYEAYNNLENIDYNDLTKFYNTFLNSITDSLNTTKNNKKENRINRIESYILPSIKINYKYSLILDLDETLVFFQKENVFINTDEKQKIENEEIITNYTKNTLILRPGLIDFLRKMKNYFELILFSSGIYEYVNPIINMIEKDEKFFEYILYRKHIEYDENGEIIKNLDILGRNLKNIIIVDDVFKYFKLHKDNGICIKPFKGDRLNDGDALKCLGEVLIKIVDDAENTGDIRISLSKFKNLLYPKVINNKLCL